MNLEQKVLRTPPARRRLETPQAVCKKRVIFVIDVAADADGSFGNQTLFASLLAANIMKNAFPISNHDIRDDLFEGWIGFGLGAGLKAVVLLSRIAGR
jgi:hypothetical protein